MKKILLSILLMLIATAGHAELVTQDSMHGVQETMDKFESIVKEKGMTVFARIDHHKNAQSVEMTMPESQLIIFGAPKGGTVLMQQDITIGIDLPLKVLVYKNSDSGKTVIAYKEPLALKEAYALENPAVLEKISAGLAKMSSAAAQ